MNIKVQCISKTLLVFLCLLFFYNANSQNLNFYLTTDTIQYDTTINRGFFAKGCIQNLSLTDSLEIDIIRLENDHLPFWVTGICLDVCYYTYIDSVHFALAPGESQVFKNGFKFFAHNSDTAHTKILIRNKNEPDNYFIQNFYGIDSTSIVKFNNENKTENSIIFYPNPISIETTIFSNKYLIDATLLIYNSYGQEVKQVNNICGYKFILRRDKLLCGTYYVKIIQDNKVLLTDKLLIID